MPTKVIARKLGISYRTVNWHLRNLCARYAARNSVHLIYLAHPSGNGLLPSSPFLTPHENSILHLIMQGLPMADIARIKGIRLTTARLHREHIRDRMQTASIREAAALILAMDIRHEHGDCHSSNPALPHLDKPATGTGTDR